MKKLIWVMYLSFTIYFLNGCTIKEAYLLHANVDAPVSQLPVHLSDSCAQNPVTLSLSVSSSTIDHVNGNVSKNGSNSFTNNNYNGKNFDWNISQFSTALNADIKLGKKVAVFGGFDLSYNLDKVLFGGNFGLGFFSYKQPVSLRLDAGLRFQTSKIDAQYYLSGETIPFEIPFESIVFYSEDKVYFAPFASLTIYSTQNDWIVNPFIQLGYTNQTLFNINLDNGWISSENNDWEIRADFNMISATPGISLNVSESMNLLAGFRYVYISSGDISNKNLFLPFLQMDFRL